MIPARGVGPSAGSPRPATALTFSTPGRVDVPSSGFSRQRLYRKARCAVQRCDRAASAAQPAAPGKGDMERNAGFEEKRAKTKKALPGLLFVFILGTLMIRCFNLVYSNIGSDLRVSATAALLLSTLPGIVLAVAVHAVRNALRLPVAQEAGAAGRGRAHRPASSASSSHSSSGSSSSCASYRSRTRESTSSVLPYLRSSSAAWRCTSPSCGVVADSHAHRSRRRLRRLRS